jgi:hypothetical protein
MQKLFLAVGLFLSSATIGFAFDAHAAQTNERANCAYCRGDRCGRGTIGATWCVAGPGGCIEGGNACENL